MGLRERKKEQTRSRIAAAAHRLFSERGFDGVTVAEVAREAEVAEATLFNYFPSKDALFYSGLEAFGERLLDAVARRPAGQSAPAAVREFVLGAEGRLDRIAAGDREALAQGRRTAEIIEGSPVLQLREQAVLTSIADALGARLRAEDGNDLDEVGSAAVAHALVGVHRALVRYTRRRLRSGERPKAIAADVRARGAEAFALLERGLAAGPPAGG